MSAKIIALLAIVLLIIFFGSQFLFYRFFKRTINFYKKRKNIKTISVICSILFLLLSILFAPVGFLVYIYAVIFCILFEIIRLVLNKIFKTENIFDKIIKSGIPVVISLILFF